MLLYCQCAHLQKGIAILSSQDYEVELDCGTPCASHSVSYNEGNHSVNQLSVIVIEKGAVCLKSSLITYYSVLTVIHIRMSAENRDLYLTHVVGTPSSICCISKQIKFLDKSYCARYRLEYKTIANLLKSQRAYSLFKMASHKSTKKPI